MPRNAVLMVADKTALNSVDTQVKDLLEITLGYTVDVISDEDSVPATMGGGAAIDLGIVAESVVSGTAGSKFSTSTYPVINLEMATIDDWGYCTTAQTNISEDIVTLRATGHPILGTLSGDVTVGNATATMNYVTFANCGAGAVRIADTEGTTDSCIIAWEKGATVGDASAAAHRRVFFGMTSTTSYTANGLTLIENAIIWANGTTPPPLTGLLGFPSSVLVGDG
jgi:hypothetical protein